MQSARRAPVPDSDDGASREAPPSATDRERVAALGPRGPWWKRRLVLGGVALGVVLLLGAALWYWAHARTFESTDNAFIDARVVQITPQVAGRVARVHVDDNQAVQAGQLLVEIDARDFEARLARARADAAAIEAEARSRQVDARRAEELFARRLIARQELDHAVAAARTAAAQLEASGKAVAQAELELSYTRITAPEAGRVTRKSVEVGMFVQVGRALMAIVTNDLWVVANFKETQLGRIRPGQPVDIRVDAYRGRVFRAHVDSIQRGTGARFSLFPPENATGNYVKVVQRVPVKIVFDEPPDPSSPLGPGMSVVPRVRVR